MLGWRLDGHQVNDVDDANLEIWKMLSQKIDCRQGLKRGNIAGASHHYVGFRVVVGAGPTPDSDSIRAVRNGGLHVEPGQRRLFPGNNHIHVVPATQTMISN